MGKSKSPVTHFPLCLKSKRPPFREEEAHLVISTRRLAQVALLFISTPQVLRRVWGRFRGSLTISEVFWEIITAGRDILFTRETEMRLG